MPDRPHLEITSTPTSITDPSALGDCEWIPAVVPGGVHESLVAAGRLAHPYRSDCEKDCRWIEDLAWWYRSQLAVPTGHGPLLLELTGVDTVADVWLAGRHVGHHANQYRPFRAVVDDPGCEQVDLVVRLAPPLDGLDEPPTTRRMVDAVAAFLSAASPQTPDPEPGAGILTLDLAAVRRRKGLFSWGWDFAPRVPSIGLTGPVSLTRRPPVEVGVRVDTLAVDRVADTAEVRVVVDVDHHDGPAPATVRAELTSPTGRVVSGSASVDGQQVTIPIHIDSPELWWTHDLGTPALHTVSVGVLDTDGGTLATASGRAGIRTLTLDRSPDTDDPETDAPARHFRFVLNGVPVFARGANLVPPSMLVGSVTPDDDRDLVVAARRGGMTMVRVWGGGTYASDAFMTACDEQGVLVWHDFMFACIDYDCQDEQFMSEVRAEVDHQTRRLAPHPSLAVWSGGNEVQAMHQAVWGNLDPGTWGSTIFDEVLPQAVRRNSPTTPYWSNSPATDADTDPRVNGTGAGDRHAWEVWHGADVGAGTHEDYASPAQAMHFRRYRHDTGRFISEFGIHASADMPTLERWIGPEHMSLDDPVLQARNKDTPRDKGMGLVEYEVGRPTTVAAYVTSTQVVQAEGLKFGIEHYRRRWPHCAGALVWQLDEPWPGMTWSLLDHDHCAKPGYYASARANSPVLPILRLTDEALELWVSNVTPEPVHDIATVSVESFDGQQVSSEEVEVEAPASTSRLVWSRPRAGLPLDAAHYVWVEGPGVGSNRLFPTRIRDLELPETTLDVRVEPTGPTTAQVTVTSPGFAYFVRVITPWAGVRADTSAVDLRPGATVVMTLEGLPEGFDPERITVRHFLDDVTPDPSA